MKIGIKNKVAVNEPKTMFVYKHSEVRAMALSDFLRDEPSFVGHLHSEQPDRPQMTASQLKAFFDYVAVFGVAIGQVNGVINYLMSPDFAANELQIINPDSGELQTLQAGIDWLKTVDEDRKSVV